MLFYCCVDEGTDADSGVCGGVRWWSGSRAYREQPHQVRDTEGLHSHRPWDRVPLGTTATTLLTALPSQRLVCLEAKNNSSRNNRQHALSHQDLLGPARDGSCPVLVTTSHLQPPHLSVHNRKLILSECLLYTGRFPCIRSFRNNPLRRETSSPILQMRKQRPREVKSPVEGHKTSRCGRA